MPDALDQLHSLATQIRAVPETVPQLRRRIARRRHRRRALVGGSVAVIAAVTLAIALPGGDEGNHVQTVDDPSGTTTSTTTEPGATIPSATLPNGALVSSDSGIRLSDGQGLTRLSDQPTSLAFSVGEGLVVAQGAEVGDVYPPPASGPVIVLRDGVASELDVGAGTDAHLHDGGIVDGRPIALVTVRSGSTPDDTEESLVLIDVETGHRRDIGVVGGWESTLTQARLAGTHIVTLLSAEGQSLLIIRSLEGAVEKEVPLGFDRGSLSVVVVDGQVVLLEPGFAGSDFEPTLSVQRYDLASGADLSSDALTIHLVDGLEIDAGFCFYAESSAGKLLCDRTSAGPIEIDLASGNARAIDGVDAGRVTLPRAGHIGTEPAPSQSVEAAERDGVIPELAALPVEDRVELHGSIEASEGTWALSRPTDAANALADDDCTLGDPSGTYGTDFVCIYEYGEIVLLDPEGQIVRAYPMPSAQPSWIYLGPDAVLAGRIGDGGQPSSTLVRIDRQSLAAQVIVFPQPDSEIVWPRGWHVATADQAAAYPRLVSIGPDAQGTVAISEIGHVAIDEKAIDEMFRTLR